MAKRVVVGVCGSIAAYKAAEVVSALRQRGWQVRVVMTEAATRFITPLTLETLSGNRVAVDMFDRSNWEIAHIALSEFADVLVIVGATADVIGKIASGICDDLLTCTVAACDRPVFLAPAMNERMWKNSIVQENVGKLTRLGYRFIGPDTGYLACGKEGVGRLADPSTIVERLEKVACRGRGRTGRRR